MKTSCVLAGYNQDIKFSTEFNVWTSNKRKEITRERREERGERREDKGKL